MSKIPYTMTPEEFYRQLISLYRQAREPVFYHPSLARGRSHSISSQAEDLFGLFLAMNTPRRCKFYIDQAMQFGEKKYYPDVVIQETSGTIYDLVDLKTDIGWSRKALPGLCQRWDERLRQVKGTGTYFNDGRTKKEIRGNFAEDIILHIVILTAANGGNLAAQIKQLPKYDHVQVYLMADGKHPNTYGIKPTDLLAKMGVVQAEFDRFMQEVCLRQDQLTDLKNEEPLRGIFTDLGIDIPRTD